VANEKSQKKLRRLRQAPQTMRERAAVTTNKQPKPNKLRQAAGKVGAPFRATGKVFGKIHIWKPFKVAGRFVGRIFVPPYVRNSFKELRQVTWPDRKQTLQLTSAVIIFSVVFGIVVALFDFGLDKLFKQVILR
jgi:preprotein translocase SecE subunit